MKVGIDIEKISRMNEKLIEKVATKDEIKWLEQFSPKVRAQHMGSLWVAKEATVKALGGGDISEVEHMHEQNGRPKINLFGKTKQIFEKNKFKSVEISISHTKTDVIAIVLIN